MEFKYKAWDKELKRMFKVESLEFNQWWVQCEKPLDAPKQNDRAFYGERNSFKNEETDRHIILPYTGVKDINKKESYLGDIVKEPNNKYDYGIIEKESESNNMFITWWYPSNSDCKLWNSMKLKLIYIKQFEVIGNIYTNADMTKKEG